MTSNANAEVAGMMRSPEQVMSLSRMGCAFQTRLSFMRHLIRKMNQENWRFEKNLFDIDDEGYGAAVYTAHSQQRPYSLVVFTNEIPADKRSDRVVADVWDATFNLFDGIPTKEDVERLSQNTPKQEGGRFEPTELVLARANKSLRLCDHLTNCLSEGQQPDLETLASVGYLFRTTAVYGSGKFGSSDRAKFSDRPEVQGSFAVEMLAVYLFRWFTIELVEHIAQKRGGDKAVALKPEYRTFLGIGNSTGLGMAPFLVKHSTLLHNWMDVRETALARVRVQDSASDETRNAFMKNLQRAIQHAEEWLVEDEEQTGCIDVLRNELKTLSEWCEVDANFQQNQPWNAMYQFVENEFSLEGQEQTVALMLEPHGDLVDELADGLYAPVGAQLEPGMTISKLNDKISQNYQWALDIDFDQPESQKYFWYYSEDKLEPRLGTRNVDPGSELEMPVAIGREVTELSEALKGVSGETTVADFIFERPEFRYIIRRVQTTANHQYAEIRDNLIGSELRPLDLLRFKLSIFGSSKFDPKSDLWTRINMYQGAPLPGEIENGDPEAWAFPLIPGKEGK